MKIKACPVLGLGTIEDYGDAKLDGKNKKRKSKVMEHAECKTCAIDGTDRNPSKWNRHGNLSPAATKKMSRNYTQSVKKKMAKGLMAN